MTVPRQRNGERRNRLAGASLAVCCFLFVRGAASWSFRTQTRNEFLNPAFNCPPGAADEAECHTRDFMYIQKHEFSTANMQSFNGLSILASSIHSCPFSLVRVRRSRPRGAHSVIRRPRRRLWR
jgi:hypothetical protein